jgi:poly-gamma-glutamate synthesis protein (capsule biosynthesis protein)
VDPVLHEDLVGTALDYVALAEARNGLMPRSVDFDYVWGDALAALDRRGPSIRVVNLETSITTHDEYWPKGINYRMSPTNIGCLVAARLDCCALANNHVIDWGRGGLEETLDSLATVGIAAAGAGRDRLRAEAPAIIERGGRGRVVVVSYATASSGAPSSWQATDERAGINWLGGLSATAVRRVAEDVARARQHGDTVVASIHWGPNWGYAIPDRHIAFAHALVDEAHVDLVHGHSSHHALAIEVYRDRLILYGCGDLLNDYEGIAGHETFRSDLGILYVATLEPRESVLARLELLPFQTRRFRLNTAREADVRWLAATLSRESARFGVRCVTTAEGTLSLRW